MSRAVLVIVILFLVLAQVIPQLYAAGTGYLAIKDYLGTVWSIADIQKIINTTINTDEGPKSLADYFWIVVDNNTEEKYNLRDFIRSPLDNETAVLPLSPGDHTIDIYWFGYHQRQLVHIVEDQHYVLKLETAPVVPFKTVGEPPSSAEWDLASNPEGLTIVRRDGKAWVRFVYNQSYIEVAWYDEDTGWNYQSLDIYLDTSYQYRFHVKDPENNQYYEEKTGSFLWLSWDIYKIKEEVKWNRTGEILHVSYIVGIAENEQLLKGEEDFWNSVAGTLTDLSNFWNYVSPVTFSITSIKDFVGLVQGAYDSWMGKVYASKYQKTVLLVWDIFTTPLQVIILAHAYDIDQNGNVTPKPIRSANGFTINNRLVYVKQLGGGLELRVDYSDPYSSSVQVSSGSTSPDVRVWSIYSGEKFEVTEGTGKELWLPGGDYYVYHVDDLSKYNYYQWLTFTVKYTTTDSSNTMHYKHSITTSLKIVFDNSSKADQFANNLDANGIVYTRNGNTFEFTTNIYVYKTYQYSGRKYTILFTNEYDNIENLIPPSSSGKVMFSVSGYILMGSSSGPVTVTATISNIHYMTGILPKMTPPQISLLKDGYQVVNNAFAVQVYTDLYREDKDAYILGYYVLGNEPPPSYIIRDVYYDIEHDIMHYVYTIISADCYGQDLVDEYAVYNSTTNTREYYLSYKKTVRLFNDVTLALFSYSRMSFLNLAPEVIKYLLALPPSEGGYGTPIIDWSTVSTITLNFSRPYELYYYNKQEDLWIRVKPVYHNDTRSYDIVEYTDNILVENLKSGDMSQYYYKLTYTDTNTTYKGWLFNDNGTLKMITGSVTWSLTQAELDQLMQQLQLHGIYDKWAEQWREIAEKLGLLNSFLSGLTNAWNWLGNNWKWILLGLAGLFLLLVLATRGSSKVVLGRFK